MLPAVQELAAVNDHEDVDGEDEDAIGSEDPGEIAPDLQRLEVTERTNDVYIRTQDCEPYDGTVMNVDEFLPGLRGIAQALGLELIPRQSNVSQYCSPNPYSSASPHPIPPYPNPDRVLYEVTLGVCTLAQHYGYHCVRPLEAIDCILPPGPP